MEERERFIESYLFQRGNFSAVCRYYRISRKTGYKWVKRYHQRGKQGLCDGSRARHTQAEATDSALIEAIIGLRKQHRTWGPRKLYVVLVKQAPAKPWPKASTIAKILKQHGLVKKSTRRSRPDSYVTPFLGYYGPNALWTADYKGQMRMGDGHVCLPLTIQDTCSRFLLESKAVPSTDFKNARPVFDRLFCEVGLPDGIRSDNGPPFASVGLGGLSALSKWWIKLGIRPERIAPGKPNQNGRHERMHRDLKASVADAVKSSTRKTVQPILDAFQHDYNTLRPHEALNYKTPAQVYTRSTKPYPVKPKDPIYPSGHFVERVDKRGCLYFMGHSFHLSPLVKGELIGIKSVKEDAWRLYFGPIPLGYITPMRFPSETRRRTKRTFKPAASIEDCAPLHPSKKSF